MAARLQPLGLHMHTHAALGAGDCAPMADTLTQRFIGKHFALHRQGVGAVGHVCALEHQAGPEQHAVGAGLPTGHAQAERVVLPTHCP